MESEEIEKLRVLEREYSGNFFEAYKITQDHMAKSHWQYKISEVNAKIKELEDSMLSSVLMEEADAQK